MSPQISNGQKQSKCSFPQNSANSGANLDLKVPTDRASDKQSTSNVANADSGSSGVYIATCDIKCLSNVTECTDSNRIFVTVANGHSIESLHIGQIYIPSGHSITAYIFLGINGSLLSVSSFVDLGYIVAYSSEKVDFSLNGQIIFSGERDKVSKLWMVDMSIFQPKPHVALPAVEVNSSAQFVSF